MLLRRAVMLLPLLSMAAAGCASEFVPYTPVAAIWTLGEPEYVPVPAEATPALLAAMKQVLDNAGEPNEMRGSTLYIQRRLAENPDYLAFLTRQAHELQTRPPTIPLP
jgi:hypothetical protein